MALSWELCEEKQTSSKPSCFWELCSLCNQRRLGSREEVIQQVRCKNQRITKERKHGEQISQLLLFVVPQIFVLSKNKNKAHKHFQRMIILLNEVYIKHLSVNQRVVIGAYCMLPAGNENHLWKISFSTLQGLAFCWRQNPWPLPLLLWERGHLQYRIPNTLV